MDFITDDIIRQAIGLQETDVFDTHDVIQTIMQIAPQEYAEQLHQYGDNPDPFVVLHPQIARRMAGLEDVVRPSGEKVQSRNVRGPTTPCERWQRVSTE